MRNNSSVSKTIRFPIEVYNQLDSIVKNGGKTFSAVVIERLTHGQTVTIVEGQTIARLLFEIKHMMKETDCAPDTERMLTEVADKIVDTLLEVYDKYMGGGGEHGNCESS